MRVLTARRKNERGRYLYWCYSCPQWTAGDEVNVTGYTDLVCPDCGLTLVEDVDDSQVYENGEGEGGE
jgi:hypothetical protein